MSTALVLVVGALFLGGCERDGARVGSDLLLRGTTMGSTWSATLVRTSGFTPDDSARIRETIEELLDSIDGSMSTWKPDSELSRFNRSQPGEGVELSPITWAVLDEARRAFESTGGAFDPTVGALVRAHGFGGGEPLTDPDADELARLRASIGFERLVERRPILDKAVAGVQLDFSAIAPGLAADRIGDALIAAGVDSFLVDVGGEFRAHGERPGGGPWRVAVEDPRSPDERTIYLVVELGSGALATSGDYRNVRIVDGEALPHLFDPRVGAPIVSRVTSSTVFAPSCAQADALATAMAVIGGESALLLAEDLGVEVFVLERESDGSLVEFESPGFARLRVDTR